MEMFIKLFFDAARKIFAAIVNALAKKSAAVATENDHKQTSGMNLF